MPQFGICTSLSQASVMHGTGWDYIEENAQTLFKGTDPDEKYDGKAIAQSLLPVPAANCLAPGNLKITGPAVDRDALCRYMNNVLRRAGLAGCRTLVFGSGGARQVPDGWNKARATEQIVEFGRMASPLAQQHGVTIVLEHLNVLECNIVNTPIEAVEIIRRVNHANFQCLVDSYHLWMDDLPLSQVEAALPYIRHVHLADKTGRLPPGQSGSSDYRPLFAMLKKAGYNGRLSVEASGFGDIATIGPVVLAYLKQQWDQA